MITYQSPQGPRIAAAREDGYVDLQVADPSLPSSIRSLLDEGPLALERAAAARDLGEVIPGSQIDRMAPVLNPGKIICVGLNYADHAAETGAAIPNEPVIFNKFLTALRGPGEPIELPLASHQVDYEAELVAVIGRRGKNIPQSEALQYVAGYTCGHDVSARDWQKGKPGGQWLLGKSFDSFAPIGPELVTAEEVPNPHQLAIQLRLNGQTMQDSSTSQLIFKIDFLVAYLSQVCTLEPGDLIFTGTPPGVGVARVPPVFLQAGDQVEVEIQGLGVLSNRVAAAK